MEDIGSGKKEFVSYEYKEITAERNKASFLVDGYECFGWELDTNLPENSQSSHLANQKKIRICLKRNRKIMNKMELTRLQRNFEACLHEIESLEDSKTSAATMYAIITGVLGTAFIAGSVLAVTAEPPHILLCILLGIPGFLGWICPYFIYKRIVGRKIEKFTPIIEEKYDEIYELCEKGNKLLY